MRKTLIRIIAPFLQRFSKWYFAKARRYNYLSVKGTVLPGVFHPQFTISTKLLMQYVSTVNVKQKSVLELGCGSGLISTLAAQKGARVTASDINPKAIKNAQLNAKQNGVEFTTIVSDLFENIAQKQFDFIIINPPYYPKTPKNNEEEAWFCGENFEYFKKLFPQLKQYCSLNSAVIMILSEDCELEKIKEIAKESHLTFDLKLEKRVWGERNYIFQLKSI